MIEIELFSDLEVCVVPDFMVCDCKLDCFEVSDMQCERTLTENYRLACHENCRTVSGLLPSS